MIRLKCNWRVLGWSNDTMMAIFSLYRWRSSLKNHEQKDDLTPNTAVPCTSGCRSVRSCEVCSRVMGSVLTSMESVPPLTLFGAGKSTVSSWRTGVETSSCLMGLNEIQQKIHSEATQKKILTYHNTLHPMEKRYVNCNFWRSVCLLRAEILPGQT